MCIDMTVLSGPQLSLVVKIIMNIKNQHVLFFDKINMYFEKKVAASVGRLDICNYKLNIIIPT